MIIEKTFLKVVLDPKPKTRLYGSRPIDTNGFGASFCPGVIGVALHNYKTTFITIQRVLYTTRCDNRKMGYFFFFFMFLTPGPSACPPRGFVHHPAERSDDRIIIVSGEG